MPSGRRTAHRPVGEGARGGGVAERDRTGQPNAEVLRELVAEQYGKLVGYARKRLRARGVPESLADAEDVVQEALRSVLARSEPLGNVRAYLYKVMDNEIKRAAHHHSTGRGYGSLDFDLRAEEEPVIDSVADDAEWRHVVGEALGALSLQQRRVMLLTQGMGMTQAEAARVLDTTPGTVATHAHRAFVALRVSLGALAVALVLWAGAAWLRGRPRDVLEGVPASWLDRVTEATGLSPLTLGFSALVSLVVVAGVVSYASARPGEEPRNWWQRWGLRLRSVVQQSFGRREYGFPSSADDEEAETSRLFRE
ncbi:sigma-70 family RNA polymerase sigma factor [Streptomyces mexicanus]|uniref:sigma-70 family RNA polymerase sigma factor n=1 Tax=Streptomyces mexicanus TaxID=178566 RepID=UPI00365B1F78